MRMMRNGGWLMAFVLLSCASLLSAEEKKPVNVDGKWTWTYKTKDGKDAEAALKLKRDGEKLTGAYIARDGTETPIEEGKVTGDELPFNVNRDVAGETMLFKYS